MSRLRALALPLAMLAALAGALALRAPELGRRPLHNDEAVNAVKVSDLWQHGRYAYDPDEYHGPSLHYASLPFLHLSGAPSADDLTDAQLRWVTVAFGLGLVLLTLLFADGLGRPAIAWAAAFTAVSPAMVFYSRYFIHEMLLVFFAALAIGAGWRYRQTRAAGWALTSGAGVGLMWVTKETFVFNVAAAAIAVCGQVGLDLRNERLRPLAALRDYTRRCWNWRHAALAGFAMALIWLLFFSSFFRHADGLLDSVRTYLPWLNRAGGHSPHVNPWSFYLERLSWFHATKGPVFTEALILALAAIGALASLSKNGSPLGRFLTLYTLVLTAVYCLIPYKTPWCLLGFYHGMILLAGVGTAAALGRIHSSGAKAAVIVVLLAGLAHLSWQAWQTGVTYAADRRNPYVYAQTSPDLRNLVQRLEAMAGIAPDGFNTVIKTVVPEADYWPLPWSLRRFHHVGWYQSLPEDPFAPIIIVASTLNARLDEKSDKKWIMAGFTELRPGKFLELYVELELWKKFVATLPRDRDSDDN